MFMFWSKRTVLTRRLLKAKVRGEHETECEAQEDNIFVANGNNTNQLRAGRSSSSSSSSSSSNNSGSSNNNTRQHRNRHNSNSNSNNHNNSQQGYGRDNNNGEDHPGRLLRCKELLKTLKENQLEMLLAAVESCGADLSSCVLVPRRHYDVVVGSNDRLHEEQRQELSSSSSSSLLSVPPSSPPSSPSPPPLPPSPPPLPSSLSSSSAALSVLSPSSSTPPPPPSLLAPSSASSSSSSPPPPPPPPPPPLPPLSPSQQQQQLQRQSADERPTVRLVRDRSRGVRASAETPLLDPHLLCCQIWRWPDLAHCSELKRLPVCHSAKDPVYICCNPYHWSRLCKPESPPPPYCLIADRLRPEDRAPSERDPRRCKNTSPLPLPSSLTTNGEGEVGQREWCTLAYWELGGRVGRLYPVEPATVNVFDSLLDGDGLCLATLAENHSASPAVQRTRSKIGLGLMLSQEADGVWAYNRSDSPIFVNSPTLDDPESRTLLVYRVPPGFCLNIFDRAKILQLPYGSSPASASTGFASGPVDVNSVRISFAKGWGPKYSRQEVTSCPCWLEVLLAPCR